ncbi:MAG: ankyrin repeat domain-containing protein [Mariprofundaceae bacterium]|nr:ankyrin repeat domain-containing protein [Mariprofundaceae bacterium]
MNNLQEKFYTAVNVGDIGEVSRLVSLGAGVKAGNNRGVQLASKRGHLEIVRYLVSVGADVTDDNNYAVQLASEYGHLLVVKYLVSLGADVMDGGNRTVQLAIRGGHSDIAEYLVSLDTDNTTREDLAVQANWGVRLSSKRGDTLGVRLCRWLFSR